MKRMKTEAAGFFENKEYEKRFKIAYKNHFNEGHKDYTPKHILDELKGRIDSRSLVTELLKQ